MSPSRAFCFWGRGAMLPILDDQLIGKLCRSLIMIPIIWLRWGNIKHGELRALEDWRCPPLYKKVQLSFSQHQGDKWHHHVIIQYVKGCQLSGEIIVLCVCHISGVGVVFSVTHSAPRGAHMGYPDSLEVSLPFLRINLGKKTKIFATTVNTVTFENSNPRLCLSTHSP